MIALLLLGAVLAQDAAVCIDPGHGGSDPGAVGNGLYESELNLEAALDFRAWLELDNADSSGGGTWEICMTRETDVYVSLSGRCDYANSRGVDYFMSIHTNAGGGDGTETYAYTSGGTADALAHKVQEEVIDHLGTRDRGVKYASFTVLTDTSMPADLNEMAFIDTWAGNAELLSDPANLDRVALAHLHALQRQVGLAAYTPSDEPEPEDPTATVSFSAYPRQLAPGEDFGVSLAYDTNLHELGLRGQLGLRMEDAATWRVLDEQAWDNGGAGLQGPAGTHTFDLQAPANADAVIFVAWFAPLGQGWDRRYADASTAADPTEIQGGDDTGDTGGEPAQGTLAIVDFPELLVLGQEFEVRVRVGAGVCAGAAEVGLELWEEPSGQVVQSQVLPCAEGEALRFPLVYEGSALRVWFHACAYAEGELPDVTCLAEDDTEGDPTAVVQRRDRIVEQGCGCAQGAGATTLFGLLLAPLAWAARRGERGRATDGDR